MQDGMGVVPCWGNAPVRGLANSKGVACDVLMLGTGEFGHCLKTAAQKRLKAGNDLTHFEAVRCYALEQYPETLARHTVLLATSLDVTIGLRERTEMFLEIYGNAYLSLKGLEYVKQKATQVGRVLSGNQTKADAVLSDALDYSHLKHKELDQVMEVLVEWSKGTVLDMDKYWDNRLRRYYKDRYDARKNTSDWDYNMKLKDMNLPMIGGREFIKFRLFGVAFEFRDTSYTVPNITMGVMVQGRRKGCSVLARGYWSDIVNSPYISFGIEADAEKLFKVRNRENVYTACDISEFNITQMLHLIVTGELIQPKVTSSGAGSFADDVPSEEAMKAQNALSPLSMDSPPMKLVLLLGSNKVLGRARYQGLFDAVVVSNLCAGQATEEINPLLRTEQGVGAIVTVETAKFVLDFHKDQKTEFLRRVYAGAEKATWVVRKENAPTDGQGTGSVDFLYYKDPPTDGQGSGIVDLSFSNVQAFDGEWQLVPRMEVMDKFKVPDPVPKKVPKVEEAVEDQTEKDDTPMKALSMTAKEEDDGVDSIKQLTQVTATIVHKNPDRVTRRPRELLVKVRLPGLTSAAAVDVNVDGKGKTVTVTHYENNIHTNVCLPYPVDEDAGSATFDAGAGLLVLTLVVVELVHAPEEALQHLENTDDHGSGNDSGNCNAINLTKEQDHAMVRHQALRGMALPRPLCPRLT